MRQLIMLGTGNAMVTKYYNTCFAIKTDDGIFLVDAGGGNAILAQMERAQLNFSDLHHMFVTHGHTDHVLGVIWAIRKIADLMGKNKYEGNFHIYGHAEVINIIKTIAALTLKKKDLNQLGSRIILETVRDGDVRKIPGMQLTFFDILSTKKQQFGFSAVFSDGYKFSCLGDEPYNDHCHTVVENSDILLSEAFCLYADRDKFNPYEKYHSTVKEACEVAKNLNAKAVLLYHTEDKTFPNRKARYLNEADKYFSGEIYVPDDLEQIDF